MHKISESSIETILVRYEDSLSLQNDRNHIELNYPDFYKILIREDFEILTEEEIDTLLYLFQIVTISIQQEIQVLPKFDIQKFDENEEKLWGNYQDKQRTLKKAFDDYFSSIDQEELLAVLEDTLTDDTEEDSIVISSVGKEVIMIVIVAVILTYDALN
ncbi:MAG: hypothetical protein R2774_11335 [Saprospiraceae bacterium]